MTHPNGGVGVHLWAFDLGLALSFFCGEEVEWDPSFTFIEVTRVSMWWGG